MNSHLRFVEYSLASIMKLITITVGVLDSHLRNHIKYKKISLQ